MNWEDAVRVEIQSAIGVWVDVTDLVRFSRSDLAGGRGRSTELDQIGPGSLRLALDNSSGIFTPGVASAALSITLAMPIRVVDVIGYRRFPWFTGTLEMPDSVEQLEGVDNLISVTAVDRKQLLDGGRTFVSTLTEHISAAGGTDLVAHWTLGETADERAARGLRGPEPALQYASSNWVTLGSAAGPPGDDLRAPVFVDAGAGSPNNPVADGTWETANRVNIASSDTITIAAWINPGVPTGAGLLVDALQFTGSGTIFIGVDHSIAAGPRWNVGADFSGWGPLAGVGGPPASIGAWTLVALRFGLRDAQDLWVGTATSTLSFGGGAPASGFINNLTLSPLTHWPGSIAHVQIYRNYTRAQHLLQVQQGFEGLAGQRTDERIATILGYVTGSPPAVLDEGSTYMQRATLAGRKPGQLIDDAVATERGRLFVDGDGTTTFHSRVRAYNL